MRRCCLRKEKFWGKFDFKGINDFERPTYLSNRPYRWQNIRSAAAHLTACDNVSCQYKWRLNRQPRESLLQLPSMLVRALSLGFPMGRSREKSFIKSIRNKGELLRRWVSPWSRAERRRKCASEFSERFSFDTFQTYDLFSSECWCGKKFGTVSKNRIFTRKAL